MLFCPDPAKPIELSRGKNHVRERMRTTTDEVGLSRGIGRFPKMIRITRGGKEGLLPEMLFLVFSANMQHFE